MLQLGEQFTSYGGRDVRQFNAEEKVKPLRETRFPPRTCEEWLNSTSGAGQLVSADGTIFLPSKNNDNKSIKWPNHPPHLDFVVAASQELGKEIKPAVAYMKQEKHDVPGNSILGTLQDIKTDLEKHAPLDTCLLDNIDKRLCELEKALCVSAFPFISYSEKLSKEGPLGGLMKYADKSQVRDSRAIIRRVMKKWSLNEGDSSGSAENQVFPGLNSGAISIPLPQKLESLAILNVVNECIEMLPHLTKSWKAIFFCETTTSILQNSFWWMWMDYFKPNEKAQMALFDQIAEDFIEILVKINMDKYSDEIFMYFPVYLAQALYSVFSQAYPNSYKELNTKKFLDYLSNTTSEWFIGVKSQPDQWKYWPRHCLNPHFLTVQIENQSDSRPSFTEKDVISLSNTIKSKQRRNTMPEGESIKALGFKTKMGLPKYQLDEAIKQKLGLSKVQITSSPTYECVRFNLGGRSPLLQHYLYHHNLTESTESKGPAMSRTQIKDFSSSGLTYEQALKCYENESEAMYNEYESQMAQSNQAILLARGKHVAKTRKMERINQRLLQHRYEVAILAEKLVASQREVHLPNISANQLQVGRR